MENKITTPVVKGLLLSMILIVFGLALHFTGNSMNKSLGSIQYVIIVGGIIWACIVYANQMENNVTFGNVFAHGFKMTAVVAVITVVYTVLSFKVFFPEMIEIALEETTKQLEKNNMPQEQMDTTIEMTRKFFIPFAIAGVLVGTMFIGAISSLIGAAVAKKNPKDPFTQQS